MTADAVHTVLLTVHIAAGTAGLVLGPLAMFMPKRRGRHTRLGLGYQAALAVLTVSALGLASLAPIRLWWLALIAVGTQIAALVGWQAARQRRTGWLSRHVGLMCGSYLSLVTALLVVSWDSPLAWLLPTVIGSPLIARASARASARQSAGADADADPSAVPTQPPTGLSDQTQERPESAPRLLPSS